MNNFYFSIIPSPLTQKLDFKTETKVNALESLRDLPYSFSPFPEPSPHFYERSHPINIAVKYIESAIKKHSFAYEQNQLKFKLLGTSGIKGIGKTQLLKRIGEASQKLGLKALYVTFNGTGAFTGAFLELIGKVPHSLAFLQGLLISAGVPRHIASQLDHVSAWEAVRFRLGMSENDHLLICIDEIGELREQAERTLTSLMRMMDELDGGVIFVFSHILQSFLDEASTGSGRPVIPLPLFPLSIDIWKNLDYLKIAAKNPSLHQLFLSCCGHPRAIFDGLPKAIQDNPTLLSDPTESAIISARRAIIELCKFNDLHDPFIEASLLRWFSLSKLDLKTKEELKAVGFLTTMSGVDFPLTLLVQDWATRCSNDSPLAYHLQQIYSADSILGLNSEKWMELVMMHYEAVIKIAQGSKPFPLDIYYQTPYIMSTLQKKKFSTSHLETSFNLVCKVDNFDDTKEIVELLTLGYIVVSEKQSQIGVEYLVPFWNNNKLVVAAVQCKFIQDKVHWAEMKRNMTKAIEKFEVEIFPVFYTTTDHEMQKKTYSNGVYFTEEDIFKFTSKLGILRLHTQKLGQKLRTKYPLLEKAASGDAQSTTH